MYKLLYKTASMHNKIVTRHQQQLVNLEFNIVSSYMGKCGKIGKLPDISFLEK